MTNRIATATEVRNSFKADGHTVRITRDEGRVTFKRNGEGPWLVGRWVSEYRVTEDGEVYLS